MADNNQVACQYKFLEKFFKFFGISEQNSFGTYAITFTCAKCSLPGLTTRIKTTSMSLSNLGKHILLVHPNDLSEFKEVIHANKLAVQRYKFLEVFFKFVDISKVRSDGTYLITFTCVQCSPATFTNIITTNLSMENLGKHIIGMAIFI